MARKQTEPKPTNQRQQRKGRTPASTPLTRTEARETKGGLLKIGALWIGEGRNGKFMSGRLDINGEEIRILVFKNSYKEERKHPDYVVYEPSDANDDSRRENAARGFQ